MNRRAWIASGVALAMIAGAATFLVTHHHRQRLGEPGVRVEDKIIYGYDESAPTNAPFLAGTNRVFLPEKVLNYQSRDEPMGQITVNALPKDTTYGRHLYLRTNTPPILCQVVLMGSDRTSIHKPQYCLKGMGLQAISSQMVNVPVKRPHSYDLPVMRINVRGLVRDPDGNPQPYGGVYVYWFVANGELTASHADRMWWLARDLMFTGVLQRWAYVVCYSPCAVGSEDATFDQLKEFIAAAVPEFQITAGPPRPASRAAAN